MPTWSYALVVLAAASLALSALCHVLLWSVVRRRGRVAPSPRFDAVSVLKPLCGVDVGLARNLETLAQQTHANLQLILGVSSAADDALAVASRFRREHPSLEVLLSVGEADVDNPKVALLARMLGACRGEWIVVSDSNVRLAPDYVSRTLAWAEPDVGLITHLVSGAGGRSPWAHCENLQLNGFVAPGVCGARFLCGRTCVIGKSIFLRREVLEAVGGFRAVGGYLAEDYALGIAVARAGYRVVTDAVPVTAWHEGWTLARFLNRHLRWAVMRRSVSRWAYATEALLNPGPALWLLLLSSCSANQPWLSPGVAGSALFLEAALVALSHARMTGRAMPMVAWLVNPLREWLTLGVWVAGWFVREVTWRGTEYRVKKDGQLEAVSRALPSTVPR